MKHHLLGNANKNLTSTFHAFACFAMLFLFIPFQAKTQVTVTGNVANEKGEPLGYVTVLEKGTGNGTPTDDQGNFRLTVASSQSVLLFSFVGYADLEIPVGTQTNIRAVLSSAVNELDDVVIVGYGTQKKLTNTGAQASMAGKLLVE